MYKKGNIYIFFKLFLFFLIFFAYSGGNFSYAKLASSSIENVKEEAHIKEFFTDKKFYSSPFKVNFTVSINNTGNVEISPRGIISIRNIFKSKVAKVWINDEVNNILPNSARQFENFWQENFAIGRYKAEIGLSYGTSAGEGGQGRQTITAITYFWIIPIREIIFIFAVLILLLAIFFLFLKLYFKKILAKDEPEISKQKKRKNKLLSFIFFILSFVSLAGLVLLTGLIIYVLIMV